MTMIKYLLLLLMIFAPMNFAYSGFGGDVVIGDSDVLITENSSPQLSGYYDLRERSSYFQITNPNSSNIVIHVQIFQHDRDCTELDFFDTLTPNDTVVYDLDNIVRNNGTGVPISLLDDSYGYVVVSIDTSGFLSDADQNILGNFRIIDDAGYEYRVNMLAIKVFQGDVVGMPYQTINFNTVDGANQADVVGYSYYFTNILGGSFPSTVKNADFFNGFEVFAFDLDEEPLSCDVRSFACGNIMNYGINEDYPNSRGGPLLCPGGGLANPNGGFVRLNGIPTPGTAIPSDFLTAIGVGLIGLNNGNGTGSMDYWFISNFEIGQGGGG